MPTSAAEGKGWAQRQIVELQPLSVLDVGAGFGTYARLCRHLLPQSTWEAVEIWTPYVVNYGLPALYNRVFVCDARANVDWDYDLVIFGDVLEHMPLVDAQAMVAAAQKQARAVLVSAPIVVWEQGAVEGNPHEEHVHHFSADTLRALVGSQSEWLGQSVGYFLWRRDGAA